MATPTDLSPAELRALQEGAKRSLELMREWVRQNPRSDALRQNHIDQVGVSGAETDDPSVLGIIQFPR